MMPRTIAIGDIHGNAYLLEGLLRQVKERAQPGDTLVFIGDYIDRGADSREVVEMVLRTREEWNGLVVCLRGNHEDMLLDSLGEAATRTYDSGLWEYNGGDEAIQSYASHYGGPWPDCLPEEHRRFFRELRLWHEDEHAFYVHAGLEPGQRPEETDPSELVWIRDRFIDCEYDWGKPVVFGHTPQFEGSEEIQSIEEIEVWRPLNWPEKIGIDTGAAYGGPLCAVIMPERDFLVEG